MPTGAVTSTPATVVRMVLDPRGALLESARDCEAEVFGRWYGNTRAQLDDEYGPYADASVFLALADDADRVVAAVRLLAPGGVAGLKTLVDLGRAPWYLDGRRVAAAAGMDLASTWEVATLGVRPGAGVRDVPLALALYHGLALVARANRMSAFVAILDERVRRLLASVGLRTQALPGATTAPYLGSAASTPVHARCGPLVAHQRRACPDAYRLVTLGIGLDAVAVPPPGSFRLRAGRGPSGRATPGPPTSGAPR